MHASYTLRSAIRTATFGLALLAVGLGPLHAADKPIRLKLGTIAPAGTSYHKALQAMGEKWRKLSNGSIQLTIFAGGTQGSEADMVGLMQTGNLDAALVTTAGLSEIDPGALALEVMPMFFSNLDNGHCLKISAKVTQLAFSSIILTILFTSFNWLLNPIKYSLLLRKGICH
ncbi:MAG TPA: TRAP transporter substrate-binding protein DctP [Verrucomicrobiae bacterium]